MKGVFMRTKLLCCFIYVFGILSSGFKQSVWEWRNPLTQGNNLDAAAFGNNKYIAVGEWGTILTSPDGTMWTDRALGLKNNLNSVTYGKRSYHYQN